MRLVEPRTYRWSRAEFHQMAELGWFDEKRVELIDGEIVEMPVPGNPHCVSLACATEALRGAFGGGFWIRMQMPLNLDPSSEPMPDLAVVPGKPRDYTDHPTTALLVVEISETTLWLDRNRKASLYARSGLADYWIVNLVDRRLEVFRNPVADPSHPSGFRYADVTAHDPGDVVIPLAAPTARVAVSNLLP